MTFRLPNSGMILALILGASSFLVYSGKAADRPRGRPIEFSDRKSDEVSTNLSQFGNRKAGLQQLEEDLGKPFQTFTPKSSLDGVFNFPVRQPNAAPVVSSKRAKELIEKQKNWIFMTPEDLGGAPKEEDMFKFRKYDKDGQEKKETTALERFMQRQEDEKNPTNKKKESKESDSTEFVKRKEHKDYDDSSLPESLRDSEKNLNKLFESDRGNSLAPVIPVNSLPDIFGFGTPSPSTRPMAENPNITKYKQLLDSRPFTAPSDSFGSLPGAASLPTLDSLSPRGNTFTPSLGTVSAPAAIPGLMDAKSYEPAPLRVEPPKSMIPPTPTFAVPQRRFQ